MSTHEEKNQDISIDMHQQNFYNETMQQIIKEHFVDWMVAQELKKLGFQNFCLGHYFENKPATIEITASGYTAENKNEIILAPSYMQAARFMEFSIPKNKKLSDRSKACILLESSAYKNEGVYIIKSRNVPGLIYHMNILSKCNHEEPDILIFEYRNSVAQYQKLILK